jgi:hypothetical protein
MAFCSTIGAILRAVRRRADQGRDSHGRRTRKRRVGHMRVKLRLMSRQPGFAPNIAAALASGPFMAKLNRTAVWSKPGNDRGGQRTGQSATMRGA